MFLFSMICIYIDYQRDKTHGYSFIFIVNYIFTIKLFFRKNACGLSIKKKKNHRLKIFVFLYCSTILIVQWYKLKETIIWPNEVTNYKNIACSLGQERLTAEALFQIVRRSEIGRWHKEGAVVTGEVWVNLPGCRVQDWEVHERGWRGPC